MAKSVEDLDGGLELVDACYDVGYDDNVGVGLYEDGDGDARW